MRVFVLKKGKKQKNDRTIFPRRKNERLIVACSRRIQVNHIGCWCVINVDSINSQREELGSTSRARSFVRSNRISCLKNARLQTIFPPTCVLVHVTWQIVDEFRNNSRNREIGCVSACWAGLARCLRNDDGCLCFSERVTLCNFCALTFGPVLNAP